MTCQHVISKRQRKGQEEVTEDLDPNYFQCTHSTSQVAKSINVPVQHLHPITTTRRQQLVNSLGNSYTSKGCAIRTTRPVNTNIDQRAPNKQRGERENGGRVERENSVPSCGHSLHLSPSLPQLQRRALLPSPMATQDGLRRHKLHPLHRRRRQKRQQFSHVRQRLELLLANGEEHLGLFVPVQGLEDAENGGKNGSERLQDLGFQ